MPKELSEKLTLTVSKGDAILVIKPGGEVKFYHPNWKHGDIVPNNIFLACAVQQLLEHSNRYITFLRKLFQDTRNEFRFKEAEGTDGSGGQNIPSATS